MHKHLDYDYEAQLEEIGRKARIKNLGRSRTKSNGKRSAKKEAAPAIAALENPPEEFKFSYEAKLHEGAWIHAALNGFYEQMIDDVLRVIRGGKEASVYQCLASPAVGAPYLAAKIYRPRMFRNLKNDHIYREGRGELDASGNLITNDGMLYAIRKRTRYGLELQHTSWINHEYKTLQMLHAAGADVPKPYASGHNTILMEFIGGEDTAAPTLNGIDLPRAEASDLFERVLHNIQIMLEHNRIHGDLSAYNILYWEGEIKLIDFPQAIEPQQNPNSFRIFERDVIRICEYFERQGVKANRREIAANMWMDHHYRITPALDPRFLDAESDEDRQLWDQMKDRT
ncbi:MAG TPA: RIO1 family regulatory kinase/ATPase [Levilinea sp.]|nr:RIO1 family regulatory kinase/ATPase [Levilinea sp.]